MTDIKEDPTDINENLMNKHHWVGRSNGILSRLFRIVVTDLNVSTRDWHNYMMDYLNDPINQIPMSGKERSTARGNLNKQLQKDPMSIKTFLRGLKFLKVLRVKFTVTLVREEGVTNHSVNLNLSDKKGKK
jgi:hypothetical protein